MIPLRLRSSRSIRKHSLCSSCCTHVAQGAAVRAGHAVVTARTYATRKKRKQAESPTENSEQETKSEPEAKKEAKPEGSDETKSSKPATDAEASSPKATKPTGRTKKTSPTRKEKEKKPKESTPRESKSKGAAPKPDETVELWKETLDILKSLQITPPTTEAPSDGDASKEKDGKKADTKEKRSLKSHFAPIQGAPSKATQRQAKLLEGTLDVLKNVLTMQADQRAKAGKSKNVLEDLSSQKGTTRRRSRELSNDNKEESSKVQIRRTRSGLPTSATPATAANRSSKGTIGWDGKKDRKIKHIDTAHLALEAVDTPTAPVPSLSYDLERVLFNEGVYVLQDPRSKVYNFDPYLATIMPVDEFDFDALKQYVTSSKDELLIGIAKKHKKQFTGSTSSMTSTLAHFHYLLSSWRPINPERMSRGFVPDSENFGAILRAPAATFLHYKDGTYAIDADKEHDSETILSMLGKSMEKLLTVPKDEFEKYRRRNSHQLTEEERNAEESYHYTTFRDFMMRSQLDAYDPRLPGSGVFDLKTRAVVSIRMDATHHEKGVGYEIRQRQGQWESFEREYYDMIRLAFLKYSLQVRMGRMDGIFVAYHNTQRIFGFQYVPLEEMDLSIHGTLDRTTGNREFMASLQLWEEMLKKAAEKFPEQSLRVHVETRPSSAVPFMYFFAEPVTEDEITAIQERKKEDIAKFHEKVLGIKPKPEEAEAEVEPTVDSDAVEEDLVAEEDGEEAKDSADGAEAVAEEDSEDVWEDMMEAVEETMENDAQGITAIREAIEEALEESGLLHAASTEEAQRYVEALLTSIVDVESEQYKAGPDVEDETVAKSASAEAQSSREESGLNTGSEDRQDSTSKQSPFGFLSSWFGGKENETHGTAEGGNESRSPQEQLTNASSSKTANVPLGKDSTEVADAGSEDAEELSEATNEVADGKPDDSLKDLIIKLTTRVGLSSDASRATEDLSEDQAKLRKFESILLEMIPKTQESSSELAEDTEARDADGASEAPSADEGEKSSAKPVLGLILTIRNNVNNTHVQRPENLSDSDKWNVEYTIEDIPDDKAQNLYESLKKRRHRAHYKEPGKDMFGIAFNGMLKHYTREGRYFRAKEEELARDKPTWVVGQSEPVSRDGSPLSSGSPRDGATARRSLPEDSIISQLDKLRAEQADTTSARERTFSADSIAMMREKLKQEQEQAEAERAVSFKQWREDTKQKQGKDS
ncbi:hypothetical protein SLS53_000115 [Cytospora paraplurivora]|uniref:Uncharacterized protein n=1 Tax=Cytospora paraplurivora TaxID=2898453 RepID=A0AAN9YPH4_9PEZI